MIFDLAIMLCEGGFCLMETDEMNFEILRNVAKSLKKSGKLIFTTLNGLFPLYHSVEKFHSTKDEGNTTCRSNTFDLMTFRDHNIVTVEDDSGNKKELECNERFYVPSEITWLLKSLGFKKIDINPYEFGFSNKFVTKATSIITDFPEPLLPATHNSFIFFTL
jgi:hypothetical protein